LRELCSWNFSLELFFCRARPPTGLSSSSAASAAAAAEAAEMRSRTSLRLKVSINPDLKKEKRGKKKKARSQLLTCTPTKRLKGGGGSFLPLQGPSRREREVDVWRIKGNISENILADVAFSPRHFPNAPPLLVVSHRGGRGGQDSPGNEWEREREQFTSSEFPLSIPRGAKRERRKGKMPPRSYPCESNSIEGEKATSRFLSRLTFGGRGQGLAFPHGNSRQIRSTPLAAWSELQRKGSRRQTSG